MSESPVPYGSLADDAAAPPPEHALLAAVVARAVQDFAAPPGGKVATPAQRREAARWLHEPDAAGPFSFRWICDHLGMDPDRLLLRLHDKTGTAPLPSLGRLRRTPRHPAAAATGATHDPIPRAPVRVTWLMVLEALTRLRAKNRAATFPALMDALPIGTSRNACAGMLVYLRRVGLVEEGRPVVASRLPNCRRAGFHPTLHTYHLTRAGREFTRKRQKSA